MKTFFAIFLALLAASVPVSAATYTAASATTAAVQAAVDLSTHGDTVEIPNDSNESWTTGITTTKRIIIRAQNYTASLSSRSNMTRNVVLVNNSSSPLFAFTTGNDFHCQLSGIRFDEGSGDGNHVRFVGSGTKPGLLNDCALQNKSRFGTALDVAIIQFNGTGGIMWNCRVESTITPVSGQGGNEGSGLIVHSTRNWATASTMGALDTGGNINVYVEDCTFVNVSQFPDVDHAGRYVERYCIRDGAWGVQHGYTSTQPPFYGGRHTEFYNVIFKTSNNFRNMANRYYWIRQGTGLFTDNNVAIQGGNEFGGSEVQTDIGDQNIPSTYPDYPDRKPGGGHNGSAYVTDPIYLWNQTGAAAYAVGYQTGWQAVTQEGDEIFINSGPNAGAKPSYSKFTYPHPLRSDIGPDSTPPSPDPATFATDPAAASSSSITMVATTATDASTGPVEYYFDETTAGSGATDSGWQSSASYTDSGLSASTLYTYRVKARDSVLVTPNETAYSASKNATTSAPADTTPPTPDPMTFASNPAAVNSSSITMTATTATDAVSSPVQYLFDETSGNAGGSDSAWQSSASYTDSGLSASTQYTYRVKARDAAGTPNETAYSGGQNATTSTTSGAIASATTANVGTIVKQAP